MQASGGKRRVAVAFRVLLAVAVAIVAVVALAIGAFFWNQDRDAAWLESGDELAAEIGMIPGSKLVESTNAEVAHDSPDGLVLTSPNWAVTERFDVPTEVDDQSVLTWFTKRMTAFGCTPMDYVAAFRCADGRHERQVTLMLGAEDSKSSKTGRVVTLTVVSSVQ